MQTSNHQKLVHCSLYSKEFRAVIEQIKHPVCSPETFKADCKLAGVSQNDRLPDYIKQLAQADARAHVFICQNRCGNNNDCLSKNKNTNVYIEDNCFNFLCPPQLIEHYAARRYYLMTPGWLVRWQQIVIDHWKFTPETAKLFFAEFADKFLFLDTQVWGDLSTDLQALSHFAGMPAEVLPIGISHLHKYVENKLQNMELYDARERIKQLSKEKADFAIVVDILSNMAAENRPERVIEKIKQLMQMLVAPEEVIYREHFHRTDISQHKDLVVNDAHKRGFILKLAHDNQTFGFLDVKRIAFPQYLYNYVNLIRQLAPVCGMALANANAYEQLLAGEEKIRLYNEELLTINTQLSEQKEQLEHTLQKLKTTQRQLIESEKMASIGKLVAGIAHELGTPAGNCKMSNSAIKAKTEQMTAGFNQKKLSGNQLQSYLQQVVHLSDICEKNITRISELIKSFRHISAANMVMAARKFNVSDFLKDVLISLEPVIKEKNVSILTRVDKNLVVESYKNIWIQILTNFIVNSFKHGFKNRNSGEIIISIGMENNAISIKYSDNGAGIAPDIAHTIFDPFVTNSNTPGTGLGLHIVYNLVVQKLKGSIAQLRNPKNGVQFDIKFEQSTPVSDK